MGLRGSHVGFAAALMVTCSFAPPAIAQTAKREIIVHLAAKAGVTLEREDGDEWVEVCFAPCDMPFAPENQYRVGGGIRDSEPFRLRETQPGLAVVVVEPRSRAGHAVGDVLIGVGSAMTFVGALTALIGASIAKDCSSCGGNELVPAGAAGVFFGVLGIIVGIDLVVVNYASRVHPESRAVASHEANRTQTMRFDLSRRREDSVTRPELGDATPIFVYRF